MKELLTAADLQEVARKVAADCLARPWLATFTREKGRRPAVRLLPFRNRMMRHLDTRGLSGQIGAALLQSGKLTILADRDEAEELRQERDRALRDGSDASAKSHGNEVGADFVLSGMITELIEETSPTTSFHAFTFSAGLTGVDDGRKVWLFNHVLKRMVERPVLCPEPGQTQGGSAPKSR
jgi:hypothetical protein